MLEFDPDTLNEDDERGHENLRLVVTIFDSMGNTVERYVGPTQYALLEMHMHGKCSATCSHCHAALAAQIGEEAALNVMYQSIFGRSMPGVDDGKCAGELTP